MEDAEELARRREVEAERKRLEELKRRTQPVQRSLPLPSKLNDKYAKFTSSSTKTGMNVSFFLCLRLGSTLSHKE